MKLNIEAMAREADINAGHAAKFRSDRGQNMTVLEKEEIQKLERFARLIVERCAVTCEALFDMEDDSCNEAEQCAAAIRNLLEDQP